MFSPNTTLSPLKKSDASLFYLMWGTIPLSVLVHVSFDKKVLKPII